MTHSWLADVAEYAVMWTPGMVSIFHRDEKGRVHDGVEPVILSLEEFAQIGRGTMLAENRHAIAQEIQLLANARTGLQ